MSTQDEVNEFIEKMGAQKICKTALLHPLRKRPWWKRFLTSIQALISDWYPIVILIVFGVVIGLCINTIKTNSERDSKIYQAGRAAGYRELSLLVIEKLSKK